MIKPHDLKWGETPFDDMTREEMLHELKVQFTAVTSALSALHMLRHFDSTSPYWSATGTGGCSYRQVESIVERVNDRLGDGQSEISRSYFRYSTELLFPDIEHGPERWWINHDDEMIKTADPHAFPMVGWNQDWRLLTLDDLKPLPDVDTSEREQPPIA